MMAPGPPLAGAAAGTRTGSFSQSQATSNTARGPGPRAAGLGAPRPGIQVPVLLAAYLGSASGLY
jgi:hypothetical protein